MTIRNILLVAFGGALGSTFRFLVSRLLQGRVNTDFPVGTMAVNLIGCLLIGLFYGLSERTGLISAEWRLFLIVGICGGFTTFSTFMNDSLQLLSADRILFAALYTAGSVFIGLLSVFVGMQLTRLLP